MVVFISVWKAGSKMKNCNRFWMTFRRKEVSSIEQTIQTLGDLCSFDNGCVKFRTWIFSIGQQDLDVTMWHFIGSLLWFKGFVEIIRNYIFGLKRHHDLDSDALWVSMYSSQQKQIYLSSLFINNHSTSLTNYMFHSKIKLKGVFRFMTLLSHKNTLWSQRTTYTHHKGNEMVWVGSDSSMKVLRFDSSWNTWLSCWDVRLAKRLRHHCFHLEVK